MCDSPEVAYHNYRDQPFCWPCADGNPHVARRSEPGIVSGMADFSATALKAVMGRFAEDLARPERRVAMGVQVTTLLILARHRVPFLPAFLASLATGELAAKAWTACEDVHKLAQAQEARHAADM